MGTSIDERRDRAVEALLAQTSLPELLQTAPRQFVEVADALACSISRLVGEVLIEVAEFSVDGRTLVLGHGYLVPDFPLTRRPSRTIGRRRRRSSIPMSTRRRRGFCASWASTRS